mmetsp:Transcript_21438/g.24907  ORF Transcript_21438/g.24907 Transcript_21438/m.24907 type:complete len:277 (+) Transcript_21438:31-861(+)
MDPEKIQTLIQKLEETQESIKKTAKILSGHREHADMIAQTLMSEANRLPVAKKLHILYVIHEIQMDTANDQSVSFLKAFGKILRDFFTAFAAAATDTPILQKSLKVLDHWDRDKIYKNTYTDKLRAIITQRIKDINTMQIEEQAEGTIATSKKDDSQYSKAFMRDYQNVMDNKDAKLYYEKVMKQKQISEMETEILTIESKLKNDDITFGERDDCKMKLQAMQDQLTTLLCLETECIIHLANRCEEEAKLWADYNQDEYNSFQRMIKKKLNRFSVD